MIVLRPASQEDRAAVSHLSSQIWDGDDYIADCFDDWVADPYGRFTVAYADKELVGFGKLTRLAVGEWWLEGLRVDPAWRGQGIARLLHEDAIRTADAVAQGTLRFATSYKNVAVHKIASDSGFHHVSDHLLVELLVEGGKKSTMYAGRLIPVTLREATEAQAWLGESTYFAACGGLLEDGWQWYEIAPRLVPLVESGRVYWWTLGAEAERRGMAIVDRPNAPGNMRFNYVDVPEDDWPSLTTSLLELAGRSSALLLKGKPLALPGLESMLSEAGWIVENDAAMRVFARQIKK